MSKSDKTVLERRKEIIGILKYFPLNEKKWIMKRFWDHIEKASSFEDETKINRKLPPKLINDQNGKKLSKSKNSESLNQLREKGMSLDEIKSLIEQ